MAEEKWWWPGGGRLEWAISRMGDNARGLGKGEDGVSRHHQCGPSLSPQNHCCQSCHHFYRKSYVCVYRTRPNDVRVKMDKLQCQKHPNNDRDSFTRNTQQNIIQGCLERIELMVKQCPFP